MKLEADARTVQRRRFSAEFKRGVVEETLVPGASVAAIAMRHRLNANLLFKWRRNHQRRTALQPLKAAKMLPVRIEAASTVVPIIRHTPSRKLTRGWIEIEYAEVKIRVRGAVDAEALRVVLEALSGR
jgi:transposase